MIKNKKILIVVPYPDDGTLGYGGTIAKHVLSGDHVTLCIVTTAYKPERSDEYLEMRNKRITKVVEVLRINNVIELGYHTEKLDIIPQKKIAESLIKVINEVQPDIAYILFKGVLHRDYRVIFESALVAMRPVNCTVKKILASETLSETEWSQSIAPFIPNVYCDIAETFLKKIEALKAYKTLLKEFTHPRSLEALEAAAKKRGSEIGLRSAEAFSLVREVV
ncbi:MAG: PIG-L family deacetylase [Methanogenium sp.]|nr:PIG-L family deacetylase [Methanogenium sp.]